MTEPPSQDEPEPPPPWGPFPASMIGGIPSPPRGADKTQPKAAVRERSTGLARLGKTAEVLWMLLMAIVAIVGGTLLHAHFAPKDALCNTVGGSLAQQQSTGAMAHCGLYGFLSGMGQIIQWGGGVGLLFCLIALWVVRGSARR